MQEIQQSDIDMEENQEYEEETQLDEDLRRQALFALANDLTKSRDEAVLYRRNSGIERQWAEDERALKEGTEIGPGGDKVTDYAQGIGNKQLQGQQNVRSQVVVNIIRGRTSVAEGRFADILLPTDERNWGLSVTPDPELDEQREDKRLASQNGQPVTDDQGKQVAMSEVAKDKLARAKKAMALMEIEIDDQLTECDYNAEQRKLIKQAARLGTGIIKGPNVVKSIRKRYIPTREGDTVVYNLDARESQQPASRWVDCWNVYPSPGTTNNIQKSCEAMWEKDTILPRDIKALIGVDGYFDDQLVLVLNEKPKRSSIAITGREGEKVTEVEMGSSYEIWEGYLDLSKEHLSMIGVDCEEVSAKTVSCNVVLINDRPVKIELNVLDTGAIPYDFFRWEDLNINSPWGIGIPRMLTWLQRILIASWRAMMDNSGDSAKSTIVCDKGLRPQSGIHRLGEIFINQEDMEDARKAFAVFDIPNKQPHYQAIIEMVLRFADLETALPTIFQGESQKVPDTLGQTNIVVDSSNVGIRHRTKHYDDDITDKHLTRYYHYNMQYNDNPKCKGDFNVDSRGTRVLLERDQQGRAVLETYALKQDPSFERAVDWDKAAEMVVKTKRLDILKDEEALKQYDEQRQKQPQAPPNPALQVAEMRAKGDMERETLRQTSDMEELRFKEQQAQLEREHKERLAQMDYDLKLMEYASKEGIKINELKVQLALNAGAKQTTPQVATPPVEPAGRAEPGQAFAQ